MFYFYILVHSSLAVFTVSIETRPSPKLVIPSAYIIHRAEAMLKLLSANGAISEIEICQVLGDNPTTSKALRITSLGDQERARRWTIAFKCCFKIGGTIQRIIGCVAVLRSFKNQWQNILPNWVRSDPWAEGWEGVVCTNSRVISIQLSFMGLKGQLSRDIGSLTDLQSLKGLFSVTSESVDPGKVGKLPSDIWVCRIQA